MSLISGIIIAILAGSIALLAMDNRFQRKEAKRLTDEREQKEAAEKEGGVVVVVEYLG